MRSMARKIIFGFIAVVAVGVIAGYLIQQNVFSSSDGSPEASASQSVQPSVQPSESPSAQPSESPSAAPSEEAAETAPASSDPPEPALPADTEPPKIAGVKDLTVYIGDKVSYKSGVTVTDDQDPKAALAIDTSAVNLKQAGKYEIVYTAKDAAGNVATSTATVTVKEPPADAGVDLDKLDKLGDRVLAKIIKDDMSDVDKAWAIFNWTKTHIGYVSTSDKSDWQKGALQGFEKGSGDCFVFYSTARYLLERVGFETQMVIRDKGRSTIHMWNLIKIGDGWYHFDTTPTLEKNTAFLLTDEELVKFNKKVKNYYLFDHDKYPATPETPLEERSKYLK